MQNLTNVWNTSFTQQMSIYYIITQPQRMKTKRIKYEKVVQKADTQGASALVLH